MGAKSISTDDLLLSRTGQFSRLSAQLIDQQLADIGITYQEMRVAGLIMGETNMTQKALAEKLMVRPATLSVAISKLEKTGIVKRIQSKTDKRVNYLKLIPSNKVGRVDQLLRDIETTLTQGIPRSDLVTTHRVLDQLISNLTLAMNPEPTVSGQTSNRSSNRESNKLSRKASKKTGK